MSSPSEPIAIRTKHGKRHILLDRPLLRLAENGARRQRMVEAVPCYRLLPRSMEVERKDFDVDIELIRVGDYAVYGLVCHCI